VAPSPTAPVASNDEGYFLYLILNAEQVYIAAVLDMSDDLHWLVQPMFRGRGHLTTALRAVILPHLLKQRKQQRITINRGIGLKSFNASEKVARAAGFELTEQTEHNSTFTFKLVEHDPIPSFPGIDRPISEARMHELRQEFAYHATCLRHMQAEIESRLGSGSYTESLLDLAEEVQDQTWRWENYWQSKQPHQ
jgi:hypothetical protein